MQMQRWLSGQDRLEWLHSNGNLHAGTVHRQELQRKARTPMQMQEKVQWPFLLAWTTGEGPMQASQM